MISNEIKKQTALELHSFMNDKELSQADVSRGTGVRMEYLVEILKPNSKFEYNAGKGSKGNIPDKWFLMIQDYLGISSEQKYWKTVNTTQTKQILAYLTDAKDHGYTNLIIGPTGCGKSEMTDRFMRHSPKDTFKIKVGSTDTIGDLLDKVLDTIKVPQAKTKSKKIRDIISKMISLKHEGLKPALIFDECEFMKQATLCNMKEFHDDLRNSCALIMMGTDQLTANLDKLRKKNRPGIPQFYRRVKFGIRKLQPIDTRYTVFFDALEIADKNLKKFLCENCDNYGELHDALVPVLREADRTGEPLTENLARKVLNMPKAQQMSFV